MKITNLDIEGFGVWTGLRVERLSDTLNVFYGPNEAGKTTLLQFIRSMLYGFSPARQRYLPAIHGGRPGGTLDISGPHGRFQIARYNAGDDGSPGEQLTLTAPDGTRQGEHFVKVLLSNVDESVFNNVFAVGLTEIQELATLADTEAAELLYNLTAGLDRVSLVEVLRALETSRNRILDAGGGSCQVAALLADREKLRVEIEELETINHRFAHLAAERDQLHGEVTHLEEESNRVERLARVADLAVAVRDRWNRRASLDEQLAALGPAKVMPEGAVERLDALNTRIEGHERQVESLAGRRQSLRREFAELSVNESLWRQASRIEAFREQTPWIEQLQGQIVELEKESGGLQSQLAAECESLGFAADPSALPELSSRRLAAIRSPGKTLRECRERLDDARQAVTLAEASAQSLAERIEAALATRGKPDLTAALDEAGNLVSQLRRRVQIDERLDQLARHQTELEQRNVELADRQVLPVGVLIGLGAVFVVGAVLALAGMFLPTTITGSIGWGLAALGLAGAGAAGGAKVMLERSNARQLDACEKQLEMLRLNVLQTTTERDALDAQLPRGGGPPAARLQAAEADLAALEEFSPLDTQRAAAHQEAEAAARRAAEAEESLKTARRRWREAISAAGLPENFAPKQVRRLAERGERITDLQRRLTQRGEELERRRAEVDSFATRLAQLAGEAGVALGATGLLDRLRELAEASARQAAAVERRDAIRREARRFRAEQSKHEEAIARWKHRRRKLFLEAGTNDEQEFRRRALECARADVLRREREAVAGDIAAALGSQCSEDAIRQLFDSVAPVQNDADSRPSIVGSDSSRRMTLESRAAELRGRLADFQGQLRTLLERRGRLNEQLESLAADRTLASKRLDMAVLEKRLEDAVARWRVLAAACRALDLIRDTYQKHRQPETLQEASGYLDRLTQGRYRRVWTPLGEHALRVDDAAGESLPVEVLSRGTREQLFLSLRLALASSYARRGAPLPLVLDDVLVNFDADRAKAAAAVLRDFAAEGHQLLVFTCHEHIMRLFKSLKAPVSQLPGNAEAGPAVVMMEAAVEEKPKQEKPPRSPRRKAAAKPEAPEPVDEEPEEDVAEEEDDSEEDDDALWEGEDDEKSDGDGGIAAAWDYGTRD